MYRNDSTSYCKDICSLMFILALVIVARSWEHPRLPLDNKCTMKVLYTYRMECNLAVMRNEVSMKMYGARNNSPRETKTLKDKYYVFSICKL